MDMKQISAVVLVQFCGIRADSIRVGYKTKDYAQGKDFFNNAFNNGKGTISQDNYKKILDKALEKEPKKKDKTCKFCSKPYFKGHRCFKRNRTHLSLPYSSPLSGDILYNSKLNNRKFNPSNVNPISNVNNNGN